MTEKILHKQICQYLKMQYKDVVFLSDMSGLKTSIGIAVEMKALRSSRAIPDLHILEPRGNYHGLIIEIKKDRSEIYLKDNKTLRMKKHIIEQNEMLIKLRKLGYFAVFGCGFDECKKIIDNYFSK